MLLILHTNLSDSRISHRFIGPIQFHWRLWLSPHIEQSHFLTFLSVFYSHDWMFGARFFDISFSFKFGFLICILSILNLEMCNVVLRLLLFHFSWPLPFCDYVWCFKIRYDFALLMTRLQKCAPNAYVCVLCVYVTLCFH